MLLNIVILRHFSLRLRWDSWRLSWQRRRNVAAVAAAVVVHVEEPAGRVRRVDLRRRKVAVGEGFRFAEKWIAGNVGRDVYVGERFQMLLIFRRTAKIRQRRVQEVELWRQRRREGLILFRRWPRWLLASPFDPFHWTSLRPFPIEERIGKPEFIIPI